VPFLARERPAHRPFVQKSAKSCRSGIKLAKSLKLLLCLSMYRLLEVESTGELDGRGADRANSKAQAALEETS
jgi:hypothetical protein